MDPARNRHDLLREYLAETDAPCPGCEYNLRGLTGGACPECGLPLAIQVSLAEASLGPLTATLVALAIAAGIGGFFLVIFLFSWISSPRSIGGFALLWLGLFSFGAFGGGVPLSYLARRAGRVWFLRQGPKGKRIATAAWTAAGIWVGGLLLIMMTD